MFALSPALLLKPISLNSIYNLNIYSYPVCLINQLEGILYQTGLLEAQENVLGAKQARGAESWAAGAPNQPMTEPQTWLSC